MSSLIFEISRLSLKSIRDTRLSIRKKLAYRRFKKNRLLNKKRFRDVGMKYAKRQVIEELKERHREARSMYVIEEEDESGSLNSSSSGESSDSSSSSGSDSD